MQQICVDDTRINMFTVEHEFDYSTVVIMDNENNADEVEIIFDEDRVYIRQYDDEDDFNIVVITPKMFEEIIAAYDMSEGSYVTR